MAKAGSKGILLGHFLKLYEQPEPLVRALLESGELPYAWKESNGKERRSDDGGELPPPGWWKRPECTLIDYERHSVHGLAHIPPFFPPMFFVRVFPAVAPKAKAKKRPGDKFDLVLKILGDLKPVPGLLPAEIERKVLPKVPPELRQRWEKVGPDGRLKPPVSRKVINLAYQEYLKPRSSK
jgi:hypothetical protein